MPSPVTTQTQHADDGRYAWVELGPIPGHVSPVYHRAHRYPFPSAAAAAAFAAQPHHPGRTVTVLSQSPRSTP